MCVFCHRNVVTCWDYFQSPLFKSKNKCLLFRQSVAKNPRAVQHLKKRTCTFYVSVILPNKPVLLERGAGERLGRCPPPLRRRAPSRTRPPRNVGPGAPWKRGSRRAARSTRPRWWSWGLPGEKAIRWHLLQLFEKNCRTRTIRSVFGLIGTDL